MTNTTGTSKFQVIVTLDAYSICFTPRVTIMFFVHALHQTYGRQEDFISGNSNITSPSFLGGRYCTIFLKMAS
jgi:hypothetical protein